MSAWLSETEIRAYFNKTRREKQTTNEENGAFRALNMLYKAVRSIKDAGYDIDLEPFSFPVSRSFEMNGTSGMLVPFSGLIHFGTETRLFTVQTKQNNEPCLLIKMSLHQPRFKKDSDNRYIEFDLLSEDFNPKDIQEQLIGFIAGYSAIEKFNTADKVSGLNKTRPDLKAVKLKT